MKEKNARWIAPRSKSDLTWLALSQEDQAHSNGAMEYSNNGAFVHPEASRIVLHFCREALEDHPRSQISSLLSSIQGCIRETLVTLWKRRRCASADEKKMSRPIKNERTRVAVSNNSASFAAFTDVNFADATDGYASTAIGEHILASVGTLCNLFQMSPFSLI